MASDDADTTSVASSEGVISTDDESSCAEDQDLIDMLGTYTTQKQLLENKPILLGRNLDKTMNIQLPDSRIVVVSEKNFPTIQSEQKPEDIVPKEPDEEQDEAPRRKTVPPDLPIPESASCVFHFFDRRVNLDSFPANATNYELLRAWVMDDPLRYRGPKAELPLERRETCTVPVTKSRVRKLQPAPPVNLLDSGLLFFSSGESVNDLRTKFLQDARTKRPKLDLAARDAPVIVDLKRRGILNNDP